MTESTNPPPLPLVPLLRTGEEVPDRDVLATWHEALADSVGVDLPHDLFAVWLYPAGGGVELIGPEALAEDRLAVPIPAPRVTDEQAEELSGVIRRAGYGSVVAVVIRFGSADVGLLLVASLEPERYGPVERALLGRVGEAIAPMLARLARLYAPAEPVAAHDLATELAHAWTEARSPRDFFSLVSGILGTALPHDLLEALIPGPAPGQQYRLGAHAEGPPWTEPRLVLARDRLDLLALFAGNPTLSLADAGTDPLVPADLFAEELPAGQRLRSLIGVRVSSAGHLVAHLIVGAVKPGLYGPDDVATLARLGQLLGPKIDSYVLTSQLAILRKQLVTLRSAPAHHARVADMLATTAQFAEATRRLAEETRSMLPCERLTLAVRLTDRDRVVLVEPGESKHWSDLPLVPIAGTPLGQVLAGEVAEVVTESPKATELIVPLRAAGRTIGALVLAARGVGAIGRADVAPVQQLADVVAPYVELVRRAAMLPAPATSGWRR